MRYFIYVLTMKLTITNFILLALAIVESSAFLTQLSNCYHFHHKYKWLRIDTKNHSFLQYGSQKYYRIHGRWEIKRISSSLFDEMNYDIHSHEKISKKNSTFDRTLYLNTTNASCSIFHRNDISKMKKSCISMITKHVSWSFLPLQIHKSTRNLHEISDWYSIHNDGDQTQNQHPQTRIQKIDNTNEIKNERIQNYIPELSRSSKEYFTSLHPEKHMKNIYIDDHIVVMNKPSGILSVPGVKRKPNLANLVYDETGGNESMNVDKMIVHRLDMDTSGIVVYARSNLALSKLNEDFRNRNVKKTYEALVCGHIGKENYGKTIQIQSNENNIAENNNAKTSENQKICSHQKKSDYENINKNTKDVYNENDIWRGKDGEINVALQRDHTRPPFMRVATPESEKNRQLMLEKYPNNGGFRRMFGKEPKLSLTEYTIISQEVYEGLPVTRILLVPITGR